VPVVGPTHAIIAVTYRCNARCSMCDIWKKGPTPEMSPKDYLRLPPSLKEINVTGGEPLLRDDLADVILAMKERCPRARIVLSTNGLLPDRLGNVLRRVGEIAVRVSLDGIGDLHNSIRGRRDAFERAVESLRLARVQGVRDVGVCATMSRHNAGVVKDVQDFALRERVQFTCTVAHSSPVFFGDKREEAPDRDRALPDIEAIKARLFLSRHPRDWFKAYFVGGLADVVRGEPRPVRCRAGSDFFYLDPEGRVYPCHILSKSMGSLLEKPFDVLARESPALMASAGTCANMCWMTCTVAPEMRRRLPAFAVKVGWAKAVHHLRSIPRAR
jgi:MoaA/NifB/PqqE/SkfB family radical SAM enzyme